MTTFLVMDKRWQTVRVHVHVDVHMYLRRHRLTSQKKICRVLHSSARICSQKRRGPLRQKWPLQCCMRNIGCPCLLLGQGHQRGKWK